MEITRSFANMKPYAIALAAGLLLLGGYSQKSEAAACSELSQTQVTFQDLIDAGSCTIGDKTFTDFLFSSTDHTADEMAATAINGLNGFWGFRLQFSLSARGTGPIEEDILIDYRVECTDGSACIDSIHADITGAGQNGGIASLAETWQSATQNGNFFLASNSQTVYDLKINPTPFVNLSKDLNADCTGQPADCFVTFSGVRNTVDQVPEPASLALLAAGLTGLGLFRRRRNNRA